MDDEWREEIAQIMQERAQALSDALDRGESGQATKQDWDLIRAECGLPRSNRSE